MLNSTTKLLLFLTAASMLTASCLVRGGDGAPQRVAAVTSPAPPVMPQVPPTATQMDESLRYAFDVRHQLYLGEFASLEQTAAQLRVTKATFPGGAWKLFVFYTGLSEPYSGAKATDEHWQNHLDRIRKWVAHDPRSLTARVGLGASLLNYAWQARGGGYAHKVNEQGWRLFEERLALAEEVLSGAEGRPACPHWYVTRLRIALGQGWEPDRVNGLFEEAVRAEPMYYYSYRAKALYLLPRWHGEPGDWERFADETYHRFRGKEGSILYAMIVTHLSDYYEDETFFKDTEASWPRIKQGFIDSEEAYGTSRGRLNSFCRLAVLAGDRATARGLFARIGDDWVSSEWKSREGFERYKAWAFGGGGNGK